MSMLKHEINEFLVNLLATFNLDFMKLRSLNLIVATDSTAPLERNFGKNVKISFDMSNSNGNGSLRDWSVNIGSLV
ncbi:hypothetical protein WICMUC_000889 [Wickerhamomyces mucosus]|uniref:Uncharacterized protein n=1 Tax=Wickerhamomyces mucosus TaxID=1378264 RepID=A0A9P8PWD3_9ASCO|nr:hypothetical protein WICMUC_000889 [Wickerhamomyces mucosus]